MIEPVELIRPWEPVLRGQLHLGGDDGVLLVHEPGRDLDAWNPLAQVLAAYRLTVFAIDLVGHGGSEGAPDPSRTAEDAVAAGQLLRRRSSGSLFVGAAGASAPAALKAAEQLGARGFFALDPVFDAAPRLPTLAILPRADERERLAGRLLREAGARVVAAHVPTSARGLELLSSDWAENIQAYVATFLNDLRVASPGSEAARVAR